MINLVVYGQVGQLNIKYGTHVNGTIILNYPDFNCRRPGKVCNRCNKGHSMHLGFICVSGHCVCIYVKQFEWKIRITHQTSASWVLLDICDAWLCLLRVMLWALVPFLLYTARYGSRCPCAVRIFSPCESSPEFFYLRNKGGPIAVHFWKKERLFFLFI